MILRSIRVEGWRCFAEPIPVGPLSDGLNVIYGPNGIGKSTLMMALVRGLLDNHNVGGEVIRGLRPWGRQLNPKVTIEFEQDGVTYRLVKQFLGSATADLSRQEEGRFVPLAEGRAADEQTRQILLGETPGRGVTDQRHWGVAQILWAAQGKLRIDQLSSRVRTTVQHALGAQISGPGAESLEKQIADAYHQFFTRGGKLRSGASAPPVVGLEAQRDAAQRERRDLLARLDEFHETSRRIEDLHHKTEQARHSAAELEDKLKKARERAQAYNELSSQRQLHDQQVQATEDLYKSLNERVKTIAATREELKQADRHLQRLEDDAPARAKELEQCRGLANDAKKKLEQVRKRREQVQADRHAAKVADRFTDARKTQAELDKLLDQIDAAQHDCEQLRAERDNIIAPDATTLQQIIETARTRDDARLRLDAAVISVRMIPERDLRIEITTAEQPGEQSLDSATPYTIHGDPDVAFRIPGVGALEATGPTQGVERLRRQWEDACAKLDEQTAGFKTKDLDRLQQLHSRASAMDNRLSAVSVKVQTLLGDRDLSAVRIERTRAERVVDEILAKYPTWRDVPPDADALEKRAEETEQQFIADVDAAERENELAQEGFRLAERKQIGHESDVRHARRKMEDIKERLERLCEDGKTDEDRSAALNEIAMSRDAAQGKLAQTIEHLKAFGDDPCSLVDLLERQLAAVREEAADAAQQLNTEEGRLQQIAVQAPYSQLVAVEEEISRLDEEIARQQIQIDAVRLLYETLTERKRDALQSVLGPVRRRANQTLHRIAGARFDDIHFDESLLPQGIAPRSAESAVAVEQISGGEQEQLYFAVRMALADVAFNGVRQLVVLDDVFTYTDTPRLARIAAILDECAERFQIVLLTCHPERYRGLPSAEFFDLERIANEGAV